MMNAAMAPTKIAMSLVLVRPVSAEFVGRDKGSETGHSSFLHSTLLRGLIHRGRRGQSVVFDMAGGAKVTSDARGPSRCMCHRGDLCWSPILTLTIDGRSS